MSFVPLVGNIYKIIGIGEKEIFRKKNHNQYIHISSS